MGSHHKSLSSSISKTLKGSSFKSSVSMSSNEKPSTSSPSSVGPGSISTPPAPLSATSSTTLASQPVAVRASFAAKTVDHLPKASPLLSSTPPSITKALTRSQPFLISVDKVLSVLTWSGDDVWLGVLVVIAYILIVLYFEVLVVYFGHIFSIGLIGSYFWIHESISSKMKKQSTLDDIVLTLSSLNIRLEILLSPITQLQLTQYDIRRLLFTTIFMSPIYILLSFFLFNTRTLILIYGLIFLTYHSTWSKITRDLLWKLRFIRLFCFYLTGVDFQGKKKIGNVYSSNSIGVQSTDGKPVRFTYVVYENQRRWLGIGWTSNLLSYERTPWTDEFLNEVPSPDLYKLPAAPDSSSQWRWVDNTWKLDLTNDGALIINNSLITNNNGEKKMKKKKTTTTPDPDRDEGFIYYDNTWKKPSSEDSFGKYTRRRRWIRTAELIPVNNEILKSPIVMPELETIDSQQQRQHQKQNSINSAYSSGVESEISDHSRRKSLRFDDKPIVVEPEKNIIEDEDENENDPFINSNPSKNKNKKKPNGENETTEKSSLLSYSEDDSD